MRILLLVHGFNALSQRLHVALREAGHDVTVEFDISDAATLEAVELAAPDLILAPFLKRKIPSEVWQNHLCLVLHPGPVGDAGPAALDWAILDDAKSWGVTLFQATDTYDAGPVWATRTFPMRPATKSSLYRHEVTKAALACVDEALQRIMAGARHAPQRDQVPVHFRKAPGRQARTINWERDTTADVLRKVRASDGMPGAPAMLGDKRVYLHDAHPADDLSGEPGALLASCDTAVAVGTLDGAVWIGRLRNLSSSTPFKLPATQVLDTAAVPQVSGYQDISYREVGAVGYLRFAFLNGAMGTKACQRLLTAYQDAVARPTKVLVLEGGVDVWSNGMDLNLIEASASPAEESWANINAMDDLAEAILRTDTKLTIAAMAGNAGAGGVFLARACDEVWVRDAVVLNPHYKDMGNLFGSEFWTYSLPRRTSAHQAASIAAQRLPMGAREAHDVGLADAVLSGDLSSFGRAVDQRATKLAGEGWQERLAAKTERRRKDEADKPLSAYRDDELQRMRLNFYGADPSYHIARSNFVRKVPKARTPLTLAHHRDQKAAWPSRSDVRRAS